jgi:hypothetical protein
MHAVSLAARRISPPYSRFVTDASAVTPAFAALTHQIAVSSLFAALSYKGWGVGAYFFRMIFVFWRGGRSAPHGLSASVSVSPKHTSIIFGK